MEVRWALATVFIWKHQKAQKKMDLVLEFLIER